MEPQKFAADLARLPETLNALADTLDEGFAGAEKLSVLAERAAAAAADGLPIVLLLGMGSSFYAADVVAREARAAGLPVTAELASTRQLPAAHAAQIVIAISATGSSVEVLHTAQRFSGQGTLVGLVNKPASKLHELSDLAIQQYAGDETSGIASRSFRHTLVMLRAALATVYSASPLEGFGTVADFADLARRGAKSSADLLSRAGEYVTEIAEILGGPDGTWTLAPVERLSSSRQAALMMREIPRRQAYASETGDWSHVDVYLSKTQDYRALIFAGSEWDEPALDWMTERGSRWVGVGSDLRGAEFTLRYQGDTDERVAQLAEVLVAEQVAAHWLRS